MSKPYTIFIHYRMKVPKMVCDPPHYQIGYIVLLTLSPTGQAQLCRGKPCSYFFCCLQFHAPMLCFFPFFLQMLPKFNFLMKSFLNTFSKADPFLACIPYNCCFILPRSMQKQFQGSQWC